MYEQHSHALIVRRQDSSRLALLFTGNSRTIWGLGPLEFLKQGGLDDINFIVLWDARSAGYSCGCSDEIPDFDTLLAWLAARVATFTHVREVFCIGISGGTLASMAAAEHLQASCSIVFGPRHPPVALTSFVRARGARVHVSCLSRVLTFLHERVERPARRLLKRPAREWVHAGIVRAAIADGAPMMRRLTGRRASVHHLFYVPSNMPDRVFVAYLRRQQINLVAHPVRPGRENPRRMPGWDHAVVRILIRTGAMKAAIAQALSAGAPRAEY